MRCVLTRESLFIFGYNGMKSYLTNSKNNQQNRDSSTK